VDVSIQHCRTSYSFLLLQIPAQCLLTLNCLKQRLEIGLAKAAAHLTRKISREPHTHDALSLERSCQPSG
jgi:hypothetical protein